MASPARTRPRIIGSRRGRRLSALTPFVAAIFPLVAFPAAAAEPGETPPAAIVGMPLAARSGPRTATLFAPLAPESTGIVTENRYADPDMWGKRFREFVLGAVGTGVAVGDYDGDGRPDLFVVSKTESNRLFRNLGNWRFEDVTERAGVGEAIKHWNQGATFVDVDNDGWLDLYVCRYGAPNLLFLNRGDGTFFENAQAAGLAINDACGMAAFADFDRDGWLDVCVQTNVLDFATAPKGQRDYLFRNNGNGTFTDVTASAGIFGESQGHSATWWDYDNDGWPDLYVGNDFAEPDKLYHNNGNGTFTVTLSHALPHTPNSTMGGDIGDVNNDGLIDFFVADMATTTHEKDQRGMVDGRAESRDDFAHPEAAPQYTHNALFLNTGTGRCLEAAYLAGLSATDWTWSARLEDLDNDGRLDLAVTNGMIRELHNTDLMARINGVDNMQERMRIMRSSPALNEANLAFRNLGDLRFEPVGPAWGLDQTGISFGAAFGDFDGDGDLDLVFSNYGTGVSVLRNDSDTGHRVVVTLRGTNSNRFGVGAKVRLESDSGVQVRQLVLARGYLSSSEPIFHFGLGDDSTIHRLIVEWPTGQSQSFTSLAVDRRYAITEPSTPPIRLPDARAITTETTGQFSEVSRETNLQLPSRERPYEETAAQPLLPMRHNRSGPAVAIGDLDGDGEDDVCVGGTTEVPTRLMLRTGSGPYVAFDSLMVHDHPAINGGPMLILDANGDGTNDLLLTKGGVNLPAGAADYQPQLLLNQGGAFFKPAPNGSLPRIPLCVGAAVAADFDRDGRLDVFVGSRLIPGQYPLPPPSVLLANHGNGFSDVTSIAPGLSEAGMVTSALWSDVDDDGWLDLLIAVEWGGIRYWRNHEGRSFEERSDEAGFTAAGTGWWTSLAGADFNGDGRPDYVAGNLGLNTPYHASPDHPALLFYGKFEDEGSPQIIEACYEGDRVVPRRGRKQLGAAVPSILQRFPTSDGYARATLGEILGDERLSAAHRFSAKEFRSGVFLSQPDGAFRFAPLPRLAQIAPIQGVAAGDFDGDGHADIYALQNSYAPIPAVGRFDGGLSQLLRGDGHGNFTPVPPAESNLIVPGDARALAVVDLDRDGWPDFFLTRNNHSTLAYRNHGVTGRHSLRVVLHGPAGNRSAVGARITAELSDGSTQTSELYAGAGYRSQSSAACFFGFSDSNLPRQIRVRWPSGSTTRHEGPFPSTTLTLSAPPR